MSEQDQGQNASQTTETQATYRVAAPQEEAPVFVARSQKDLDKRFGEEKRQAAEKATAERERELLERFGVESFDDLEGAVQAQRERQEAEATETEKERKAREKAERTAQERQEELDEAYSRIAQMAEDNALRDALAEADPPAKPERVRALLRLANRDNLDVDDDGNLTGVAEEVERLKSEAAEFFSGPGVRVNRNVGRASNVGAGANGAENAFGRDRLANALGRKYG